MNRTGALLSIATLLATLASPARADQGDSPRTVRFAIHAGVTSSTLAVDSTVPIEGVERGYGSTFGGSVRVELTEVIGLQFGLAHTQLGARTDIDWGSFEFDRQELRLTYADIDALLVATIPGSGRATAYYGAGPAFGILLDASGVTSQAAEYRDRVEDLMKPFDAAAVFTTGVDIRLGKRSSLNLSATYRHGLTNVLEPDGIEPDMRARMYNRSFSLSAGLAF